jgi:valyl-tRNA synthetase
MHLPETGDINFEKYKNHFEVSDRWILSSFQKAIEQTEANLNRYRVNESLNTIYQFFWHDFCDWYLELIKKRLYNEKDQQARQTALSIASYIMKETMGILHPYIPFISEEVWQRFKTDGEKSVVSSPWPESNLGLLDEAAEKEMNLLQELIGAIRNIRAEMNVPPGKTAALYVRTDDATFQMIKRDEGYFASLAKTESIDEYVDELKNAAVTTAVVQGIEIFIPLADLIDIEKEKMRLEKEIKRLQGLEKSINGKLGNENFIKKAPESVVDSEKKKLLKIQESLLKISDNYNKLIEG